MKKTFVAVVLCMALLFSFTVSASAYDVNDIYSQVLAIRNELGYPQGNWSSLRRAINYIADNLPSSPKDYSSVLSTISKNVSSIDSALDSIYGDTHAISAAIPSITQYLNNINSNIGVAQVAITNHIDSASTLNHNDLTSILSFFADTFTTEYLGPSSTYSNSYRFQLYDYDNGVYYRWYSLGGLLDRYFANLTCDAKIFDGRPSLFGVVHQLQKVLASDDDLQLKQDNKANEDAATDAFVNGSSSKTSLGTGDIGNLKDVGGTFNDLTSLNGQSSVSSFLSGLTSADGTGQGWFSESTRASLDAVSTPVATTRLVQKHWRGEKSLVYSISDDTSLNVVVSPAPARAPAADPDPYNMSGFEDNYNWLWGDAS